MYECTVGGGGGDMAWTSPAVNVVRGPTFSWSIGVSFFFYGGKVTSQTHSGKNSTAQTNTTVCWTEGALR